jgi:hypothetical protein
MAPLSKNQVASYLRKAGFTEDMIPTMVGIAGAESSFNPNAFNPNVDTGDQSYGLFQINMLGAMGPERREQFGIESNEALKDPLINAKAAKAIYDQQGLGAWSVYNSGRYRDFLPSSTELGSTDPIASQGQSLNTPRTNRRSVNELLSVLGYDEDRYDDFLERDKKATSLKDSLTGMIKEKLITNLLTTGGLGGFF